MRWILLLVFSLPAFGEELYVVGTLKSYHQDRAHHYNERNLGAGVEYHVNQDFRLVGEEYKNSFYKRSSYYGVAYLPFHRGDFSAGFLGVEVNGYEGHYSAVAIPVVSYGRGRFLANFIIIPPLRNMGVIAVQMGW